MLKEIIDTDKRIIPTEEFLLAKEELNKLIIWVDENCNGILSWGAVQNDKKDKNINIYTIKTLDELLKAISSYKSIKEKSYYVSRWAANQAATCDEYLLTKSNIARLHPNKKSKEWDIEYYENPNLRFDVKSTVIPYDFKFNVDLVLNNPKSVIDFYYNRQSADIRCSYNDRLFIVHHSLIGENMLLKTKFNWDFKEKTFNEFNNTVDENIKKYTFVGKSICRYNAGQDVQCKASIIFIIQNLDGSFKAVY